MSDHVVIVGAGVGGLAAAMQLSHAGAEVTVLERHAAPGGKMRAVDSVVGPIDAGPTVMTLRPIFEALFEESGAALGDEVTLDPLEVLARHHWSDGSVLDLYADYDRSRDAIAQLAGSRGAQQFARFHQRAEALFRAFEGPMLRNPAPTVAGAASAAIRQPWIIPSLTPGKTLAASLKTQFTDPRLRQLFGRYSTYVGGNPNASPALLALIWHAESQGVWSVEGGIHALGRAMERVAARNGASFRYGAEVTGIESDGGTGVAAVRTATDRIPCDAVLFNGDPRALARGLLGPAASVAVPERAVSRRSLSAFVWAFAGAAEGHAPARHNVYFGDDPAAEFEDIESGLLPRDPTIYVCAQDRDGAGAREGTGDERFEMIINGPPRAATVPDPEEQALCRKITFDRLARMGLRFAERPPLSDLTTPETFNAMFPGSDGSLYGLSPHGMTSAFRRPRARTDLSGLYLCGGGAHPGAGIPMAALSGRHAAEAIMRDLASISRSRPMATAGGMSMASPKTVNAPSR